MWCDVCVCGLYLKSIIIVQKAAFVCFHGAFEEKNKKFHKHLYNTACVVDRRKTLISCHLFLLTVVFITHFFFFLTIDCPK